MVHLVVIQTLYKKLTSVLRHFVGFWDSVQPTGREVREKAKLSVGIEKGMLEFKRLYGIKGFFFQF